MVRQSMGFDAANGHDGKDSEQEKDHCFGEHAVA